MTRIGFALACLVVAAPALAQKKTKTPKPSEAQKHIEVFRGSDHDAMDGALDALVKLGGAAVPLLRAALKDPGDEVRAQSAAALGRIGAPAKVAIPELIALLEDPFDNARWCAAGALGAFGKDAAKALPALEKMAEGDKNPYLAEEARSAVTRIKAGK